MVVCRVDSRVKNRVVEGRGGIEEGEERINREKTLGKGSESMAKVRRTLELLIFRRWVKKVRMSKRTELHNGGDEEM